MVRNWTSRTARAALARLRDEERGLTIVEGVVAALLLTLGALGVFQVFDASTRNNFRAEQSQVINNRLQAELEAIKQLPYAEIAMTGNPGGSANQNDPRWRVQGSSYAVGRNGTNLKQMAINGGSIPGGDGAVEGGVVDPGPEPFSSGDVSGQIYRFVTWTSDPQCAQCGSGAMKRVIVAAKVDQVSASFERRFQELHTDVVDPEVTPDDNPPPPEEEVETAKAEFWLTDTTCDNGARQPIVADHLAHNTRGRCANGLKNGNNRGAPDLMFTEAPALCDGCTPEDQELFDYATDSEGSDDDIGLAMPWASNDSCLLQPVLNTIDVKRLLEGLLTVLTLPAAPGDLDGVLDLVSGDANKHLRMHTWLSPKVSGQGGVLVGKGTLELYTKTVNGQIHPGEICAWLFTRQTVAIPVRVCVLVCVPLGSFPIEVDIPVVNVGDVANPTHFRYSQNPWPSQWDKVAVPMDFIATNSSGAPIPLVLPPGSQVGLSLMVKRSGTQPGQGLEVMYDAVGFESRLELETEAIIPFQGS